MHPTESKQLKVIDLHVQKELQQMISDAKHDYESNLVLNYAHNNKIFKYMSKMYYTNDSASTDKGKAQLFSNYFTQFFPQLQAHHLLYQSHK